MGLERAAAWVAGYLVVGLALMHAGLVGRGSGPLTLPLWAPTALALEAAIAVRATVLPALDGGTAYWAVVLVVLGLEGATVVAGWGLLRVASGRLRGAVGNP